MRRSLKRNLREGTQILQQQLSLSQKLSPDPTPGIPENAVACHPDLHRGPHHLPRIAGAIQHYWEDGPHFLG